MVMVDEPRPTDVTGALPPPSGEPAHTAAPTAASMAASMAGITQPVPTTPHVPRHRRPPAWRPWLIDLAVVAVASTVLTTWIFRLWDRPLRVPFSYSGDGLTQTSVVKGILETGWYTHNPRLGAPTGFNSYDFPLGGDNFHYLIVKVLSWVSGDAFLVTNVTYLIGFVLVALSAFVALRALGVRRLLAHPIALAYTFLPFHFMRGTAHLTLAAYLSVPLAVALIVRIAGDQPPLLKGRRVRAIEVLAFVGVCALIGSANAYYAVFALCLLALAAVVGLLAYRSWRHLAAGLLAALLIAGALVLNSYPALRYQADNGKNPGAAARQVYEVDNWPLRPVQLITPVPDHRAEPLARLSSDLRQGVQSSEPTQYLGTLATIGLILGIAALLVLGVRRRVIVDLTSSAHVARPDARYGLVIVGALLLGVSGGLSWLVSLGGLREVRSWGRISVFVAFAALAVLALGLQWMTRRWKPAVVAVLAAALVVFAVWDQVPQSIVPDARANRDQFFVDRHFVRTIENILDADAMVFQLPYASYPEDPQQYLMPADNQLRPYLHSRTLRWSFGAMRGREADWQSDAAARPTPQLLDIVTAIGFDGVVVDRYGYADNGERIESELRASLGTPRLVSEDERLAFYDARGYRLEAEARLGREGMQRLALRQLSLPTMWWDEGFYFEERTEEGIDHPAQREATSVIVNAGTARWNGTLRFEVRSAGGESGTLAVDVNGLETKTVEVNARAALVDIPMILPVGRTTVQWEAALAVRIVAGDPRNVAVVISGVRFIPNE